jgi:hypothetical protein
VLHGADGKKIYLFIEYGGRGPDSYDLIRARDRKEALMRMFTKEAHEEYLRDGGDIQDYEKFIEGCHIGDYELVEIKESNIHV